MAEDAFDEIERLFGRWSQEFGTELAGVPTDVIETGDAVVVRADLPGYDADDVDVTLTDDRTLEISAAREAPDVEGRYVTRERRQRTASRTVSLPASVDAEGTTADYEAGVLEVRLEKRTADDEDGEDIPVQ